MALGDTTVDSLFSVTALSDEIPDDMLFDIPEGYTEYSFSDNDTSVNENAEFPSELPEFTAGTLMMAEEVGGEYTFAYADTTQADCDAYIAALTADGFTDVGLEDVFTATKDGMVIAVYFSEGVTAIDLIVAEIGVQLGQQHAHARALDGQLAVRYAQRAFRALDHRQVVQRALVVECVFVQHILGFVRGLDDDEQPEALVSLHSVKDINAFFRGLKLIVSVSCASRTKASALSAPNG